MCFQLRYETAAKQPTLVEIGLLATVGWKWGCQPFSCRSLLNVSHCPKEIYAACLSKESMPFVKSKLPEAWGPWERQHPPPAQYGPIMLAKDRVVVSKLWITGYWLWSRLSYICDCCKSMKNCRDSVFSLCGLEVGRPAFQLPMFEKCDSLPKGDLFDMFV